LSWFGTRTSSTGGIRDDDSLATGCARVNIGTAALEQLDWVRSAIARRGEKLAVGLDVDMENVEAGVYLWRALVTDRSGRDLAPSGYRAFVTWGPLGPADEASLFGGFWEWLEDLRSAAAANGLTFRAYCYNDGAENTHMRRLAPMLGFQDDIEAFMAPDEWVDLRRVFEVQLVTGGPIGLKKTAPLSGFAWDVDDPGGEVSMLYYETAVEATDATETEDARTWLLTYNRNDVEATASLPDWLATGTSSCPPMESLGSQPGPWPGGDGRPVVLAHN
jgi:predicted RecB family nuclease